VRLGILATHPIQYYAPLFRALADRGDVDLTVYFAHRPTSAEQGVGFGVAFQWDVDLTKGYRSVFLRNVATGPNQDRFSDYDTPEIATLIASRACDAMIVLGWRAKSYWQAMRACWRNGVPVYVRGDSQLDDDRSPAKRFVKRAVYPWFVGRFAACLAVGSRSEAYFRYYGARRIVRSPHFVDNNAFATGAERARAKRSELRAAWGLDDRSLAVLFVGKFVDKKRPGDVIEACRRVSGARAILVGDGPLRTTIDRGDATFLGFKNQSELPAIYAAADVLVLPSDRQETWGLVINEAMAARLPVIVSDAAGCVPDLITPGVTGDRFPPGDVDALARALRALVDDPDRGRRMAVAAADRVAGYSAERAAAGVMEAVT
jgi:glycosyltransferase involved in cell wall biosynthesis